MFNADPAVHPGLDEPVPLELTEKLYELLYHADPDDQSLKRELESLREDHEGAVFSELIFVLCHLRFDEEQALEHWSHINEHRKRLSKSAGEPVDTRVALVSYFLHTARQYRNPKILELQLFEQTQASAYRDELTGLHNYRFFSEHLVREFWRSQRRHAPLSLLILDVDDFKRYNDTHGHEAGNRVLTGVARVLESCVRRYETVARYGGEEFVVVLPDTNKVDARGVATRIRAGVERHDFGGGSPHGRHVTVSVGVATSPADATGPNELINRADAAMYEAKRHGKNRVVLHGEDLRSYSRRTLEVAGQIRCLSPHATPVRTLDISEGGLSIVHAEPLSVGDLVEVRLDGPDGPIAVLARVVQSAPHDEGGYRVALAIVEIPHADRNGLDALLD